MSIVVTGAAGFIGARLVEHFQGEELISVDFENPETRNPQHQGLAFGKWMQPQAFIAAWQAGKVKPSAVFHMGACSSTTETRWDYLLEVNVHSSQALWNLAARDQIPFLYASSAATYGAGELGYDDAPDLLPQLKPLNLYGRSKFEFDLWALEQVQKGNTPAHWGGFKFFNVYGYGERHKGPQSSVVSKAFDEIHRSGHLALFRSARPDIADGHQSRDFVYVEDLCSALETFWKARPASGIYNLGSGKARTFLDLAHAAFHALGKEPQIEWIETPANIAQAYQYFTEAKMDRLQHAFKAIEQTLPLTSLEEGVEKTFRRLSKDQR